MYGQTLHITHGLLEEVKSGPVIAHGDEEACSLLGFTWLHSQLFPTDIEDRLALPLSFKYCFSINYPHPPEKKANFPENLCGIKQLGRTMEFPSNF